MDLNLKRFISLVDVSIFSIIIIFINIHLVTILLGRDLLRLVAYVLEMYYQDVHFLKLRYYSNRIGDASLLKKIALASYCGRFFYFTCIFLQLIPLFFLYFGGCWSLPINSMQMGISKTFILLLIF